MGLILSMDDALMMEIVFYFIVFFNLLIILFNYTSKIKYDIKFLIMANISFFIQHLLIIIAINSTFIFPFYVNLLEVLTSILYMIALISIYELKIPLKKIIALLSFVVVSLFIVVNFYNSLSILRAVSNFAVALVYIYGIVMILKEKRNNNITVSSFLLVILSFGILLKLTIVGARIYSSTYEVSILSIQSSVVVFTFLSLLFAVAINIAILFSQYDKIYSKLKQSSNIDFLTNLYNRKFIYEKISQFLNMSKKENINFAVILIDIDGFKKINDTLGHLEGDRILKEFADKIKKSLNKNDYAGRFGGDEFIIVSKIETMELLKSMNENIINSTSEIVIKGNDTITISGGAYLSSDKIKFASIDEIIKHIDKIMYKEKKNLASSIKCY